MAVTEQPSYRRPVASVTVSPGELTVLVEAYHQLAATTQDQAGNPLTGRSITWATSDAAVATVSTLAW
jgi:uncharacterized protein YjdB